ncbi:MAG: hypothetical protein KZQ89_15405 [Candidatus Thiodiazotropha sp. (ex Lucinoma kastoroae)]|nr:hypothetical protein [Candidatus Thiodiazotropha sp. (ex Lucinoma kastoroae)]
MKIDPDRLVGNLEDDDQTGRPGRLKRAGWLLLRLGLFVGGCFLLMVVGLALMSSFSLEGIHAFRQRLAGADSVLVIVRLGAIGLLIGFWRPVNVWLDRVRGWPEGQLERVLAGRWWALAMLLFVELVLVQRLHEILLERVK